MYWKTGVRIPHFPSWSLLQGDMWPKEQTPSLVTAQLLGCSIYLPSKLRHGFPFSGPAERWKLCFMKLMVGKFKFSYSSSAGGGFSCHEGHSSKHSESARVSKMHLHGCSSFTSNALTWVANTVQYMLVIKHKKKKSPNGCSQEKCGILECTGRNC